MKISELTTEQILNDSRREYNPQAWEKMVNSYLKYENTKFYIQRKEDSVHDYDKHYAVYTIPEGIRFLAEIGYSGCLHNGGFAQAIITESGDVILREFRTPDGKTGRIVNNKQGRQTMAKFTKDFGMIFTND